MKQEITVEEGYHISLGFFNELWPLIKQHVQQPDEIKIVNELFVYEVCMGLQADRYPQVPFSGGNR